MKIVATSVTRLISGMAEGERESRTLEALRDTLLPKLISGELRVDGLKKTVRDDGQRELLRDARTQSCVVTGNTRFAPGDRHQAKRNAIGARTPNGQFATR